VSKDWERCPRCGSNRVEKRGTAFFITMGFIIICIGAVLLIIPPLGAGVILGGILCILISPFSHNVLQCTDCKKAWRIR